jgi:hypothetical protein
MNQSHIQPIEYIIVYSRTAGSLGVKLYVLLGIGTFCILMPPRIIPTFSIGDFDKTYPFSSFFWLCILFFGKLTMPSGERARTPRSDPLPAAG